MDFFLEIVCSLFFVVHQISWLSNKQVLFLTLFHCMLVYILEHFFLMTTMKMMAHYRNKESWNKKNRLKSVLIFFSFLRLILQWHKCTGKKIMILNKTSNICFMIYIRRNNWLFLVKKQQRNEFSLSLMNQEPGKRLRDE